MTIRNTIAAIAIAAASFNAFAADTTFSCVDFGKVANNVMTAYQNGAGAGAGQNAADFIETDSFDVRLFWENVTSSFTIDAMMNEPATTEEAKQNAIIDFQYEKLMSCLNG